MLSKSSPPSEHLRSRVLEEGPELRLPERGIHQLFELQADRTPNEPALFSPEGEVTYRDLERRANRLANHLKSLGVGPEMRVACCLERSASAVTAVLAVLKAGGAFVALDPSSPLERLEFFLRDSGARVLITRDGLIDGLFEDMDSGAGPIRVRIDRDALRLAQSSASRPAAPVHAGSLACVLYTAGFTGVPKGVAATHRGVVHRFFWMWDRFPFDLGEVACQKASFGCVDSLWEAFGPLLQGVPSVVIPDDAVRDPERLLVALAANGVSRIVVTPARLRALLDAAPDLGARLPRLRCWACSGEALPADLAARFLRALPGAVLLNLYGPCEVTGGATWHRVAAGRMEEGLAGTPIGLPLSNSRVALVDPELCQVPPGEAGEVLAAGEGLARGYLGRPDLTAERFVPDPFAAVPGGRACRTGDLARWLPEGGGLEYLGRLGR